MSIKQNYGEYLSPSVQVVELETQDVIATSDFTVNNPWEHMTEDNF